ncbi:MAG: SAM-dependent methyltransferase, partial [Streptosporangiaceae bacterium]
MTVFGREDARDLLQAFNPNVPNVARIYDFLLGGKDNYASDREAAGRLLDAVPGAALAARDNRRFLGRAVWFLAREAGIRQFLDIGTGLPTRGNVHEIAHAAKPGAHVVYADNDPVVVMHANALLADSLTVAAVHGDLRDPGRLFALPDVRTFIDWDEPVAVLMVAVLHFLEDSEKPWEAVDAFKAQMAPGSYLVLSHVTGDDTPADVIRQAAEVYQNASAPGMARTRAQIARFFDGCGSSEVSWLCCEDEAFAISGVVDAFVFAAQVVAPVGVEVA